MAEMPAIRSGEAVQLTGTAAPIVVAHLWNDNGMASWCWEAAHALAEAGIDVRLACSSSAPFKECAQVPLIKVDVPPNEPRGKVGKAMRELRRLSRRPSRLLPILHRQLVADGITPGAYLLNSSEFQTCEVDVRQFVVGWACPATLGAYVRKIGPATGWRFQRETIRFSLATLGWWRKDWHAYRKAAGVLAVTDRLQSELNRNGISNVSRVHPGTRVNSVPPDAAVGRPVRALIVAADLCDSRKRVIWLLEALADVEADYELTLVGRSNDLVAFVAKALKRPVRFTGPVSREAVQDLMLQNDIFLFASQQDDWGYVLIEAMGAGLVVVAPRMPPFDEIVGGAGHLFDMESRANCTKTIEKSFRTLELSHKRRAWERARCEFSREAFSRQLVAAISQR